MSRRMRGLVGLVVTAILAPLAWVYLAGGKGIMHNVWRNAALGALIPWAIYSLMLLAESAPSQSFSTKSETQGEGPAQSTGAEVEVAPPAVTQAPARSSPWQLILFIIGLLVLLNFIIKPLLVRLLAPGR